MPQIFIHKGRHILATTGNSLLIFHTRSLLNYSQGLLKISCNIFERFYNYRHISDQDICDKLMPITTDEELIDYYKSNEEFMQQVYEIAVILDRIYDDLRVLKDYEIKPRRWKKRVRSKVTIRINNEICLAEFGSMSLSVDGYIKLLFDMRIDAKMLIGLGKPNILSVFNIRYIYSAFVDLIIAVHEIIDKYMYRSTTKSARK